MNPLRPSSILLFISVAKVLSSNPISSVSEFGSQVWRAAGAQFTCVTFNDHPLAGELVGSLDECKTLCEDYATEDCRSIDWDSGQKRCFINTGGKDFADPAYGTSLVEGCTGALQYVDRNGATPGWSEATTDSIADAHNTKTTTSNGFDACKKLCEDESSFSCRSIKFKSSNSECILSKETALTQPTGLYSGEYKYTERFRSGTRYDLVGKDITGSEATWETLSVVNDDECGAKCSAHGRCEGYKLEPSGDCTLYKTPPTNGGAAPAGTILRKVTEVMGPMSKSICFLDKICQYTRTADPVV